MRVDIVSLKRQPRVSFAPLKILRRKYAKRHSSNEKSKQTVFTFLVSNKQTVQCLSHVTKLVRTKKGNIPHPFDSLTAVQCMECTYYSCFHGAQMFASCITCLIILVSLEQGMDPLHTLDSPSPVGPASFLSFLILGFHQIIYQWIPIA